MKFCSRNPIKRNLAAGPGAVALLAFLAWAPLAAPAQINGEAPQESHWISEDELLESEVLDTLDLLSGRNELMHSHAFDELEEAWESGEEYVQMPSGATSPPAAFPAAAPSVGTGTTTGALAILQQAPRVQFEESANPAERGARIGVIQGTPAAGFGAGEPGAPAPALTPYPSPTPRPTPRRTPRPTPTPKMGLFKRSIRAIPLIGPKITGGEKEPEATPEAEELGPGAEPVVEPEPELYPAPAERSPAYPTVGSAEVTDLDSAVPESAAPIAYPPAPTATPLLRPFPGEGPAAPPSPAASGGSYIFPKAPAAEHSMSPPAPAGLGARPALTPDPLMRSQVATPATATPDQTMPAGTPAAYAATAPMSASTSPTLEATDLNFPNPAVEESEALREKYSAAVLAGRAADYAGSARLFREYAVNHALSKLAPRALFLAAILEPDPARAAMDARELEVKFADSKYVPELRRRRPASAAEPAVSVDEIPVLEEQLARGLAGAQEVSIRLRLGQALIKAQSFDRALQVLTPALEPAAGSSEEAEILLLISDAAIARRDSQQAARALDQLLLRHPDAASRPRVRLNQGLLFEETGSYQRARSMYNALLEQSPQTPEAELARERLRDLRML